MNWTEEAIQFLIDEWRAGTTAQTIANALGTTKNAVVGKARRTPALERRPSPLKPKGNQAPVVKATRDPWSAVSPRSVVQLRAAATAASIPIGPVKTCQWIHGNLTRGKPIRWCGNPVVPMKSWCVEHYPVVFTCSVPDAAA